jgi:integrase
VPSTETAAPADTSSDRTKLRKGVSELLPVATDWGSQIKIGSEGLETRAHAGLDYRKPYALRHTFISECIAAGIATFEIARMAETSVLQIEKTYGHLLPDAIERGRGALDAFDARSDQTFWQLSGND